MGADPLQSTEFAFRIIGDTAPKLKNTARWTKNLIVSVVQELYKELMKSCIRFRQESWFTVRAIVFDCI